MVLNDIISLLKDVGYPFLFIWSVLEGEIGLMLAGWLSTEEVFEVKKVILIAISGAMIGDLIVFMLGRFYQVKANEWLNKNKDKKDKINLWISKYGVFLIIFERFIYGTHIPVLLTFGVSGYKFKKWIIFDFIGVVAWACTFVSIGYFFGNDVVENILFFQKQVLVLVLIILFFYWYNNKKDFKDKNG